MPLGDIISYAELAEAAHVPVQRLKSIIRMAVTSGLFLEQANNSHVRHSATSAFLASNDNVYAYASYMCAKSAPTAMQMAAAHRRWGPDTVRTYETAYNVAFQTDLPHFEHLARDQTKMDEFASYMRNVRSSQGVDLKHLVAGFAWKDICAGGVVVDVGGSTGSAATALAKEFPHLTFTVQDLPANVESGRKAAAGSLPSDIASRITFQAHDFNQPQPVQGADVYLLRMILHDWPDVIATEILQNVVAAMDEKHSRLLIMDTVLPTPGSVPISVERIIRVRDLTMLQAFNSKERELLDWKNLLSLVDPKLQIINVIQPFGSAMSVLEVMLRSDAVVETDKSCTEKDV